MTKKVDMNSQFDRMKQLMKFGLNEGKKQPYSGVEYSKVAADGKLYGIVREGTKFYIKVGAKTDNLMVENFDYIGGFRNRKDNEYTSFANAQKNFDFKLRSLAEARNAGNVITESWNLDKTENLAVEATDKMKKEIHRERQIMENAMKIFKGEPQSNVKPLTEAVKECGSQPFCQKVDNEYSENEQDNIEKGKVGVNGNAQKTNPGYKNANLKKTDIQESEVLGWNDNYDYLDKSKGTEIGSSMPFDDAKGRDIDDANGTSTTGALKNGTVEEGVSMHDSDNQNTPKPGVGEIGDDEPFDAGKGRQIDEAIDDLNDDADLTDDMGSDEMDSLDNDNEYELELGDDELESDSNLEDRIADLEDKIRQIQDELGIEDYEDDDLYDDDEFDDEDIDGDEGLVDDDYDEDFDDDDTEEVYESRSYRAMKLRESAKRSMMRESGMESFKDAGRVPSGNMNKLNDFGKHPAYQKHVMTLPPKDMAEFPGYYDMNDDSVRNDAPYGEKVGSGAPFEITPDSIENAIAESIDRFLKKK